MINEQGVMEQEEVKFWLQYITTPIEVYINETLSPTEKLLFGIIKCLDGPKGCFATNQYLAKITKTSVSTISVAIANLIKEKFITSTIDRSSRRTIRINKDYEKEHTEAVRVYQETLLESSKGGLQEVTRGGSEKSQTEEDNKEEKKKKEVTKVTSSGLTTTSGMTRRKLLEQGQERPRAKEAPEQKLTSSLVSAVAIIDAWNEQESLPKHNNGTKTYAKILSSLESLFNGSFFNKIPEFHSYRNRRFKRAEIIEAIRRHSLAASNADYLPVNKKYLRVGLDVFLFNSYGKSKDSCSWFAYWLENEPRLVAEKRGEQILKKDTNTDITTMLKTWYSDVIMKGNNGHYSPTEIMNFVAASKKIKEFAESKGKQIANVNYWVGMYDCQNVSELIAKLTMEMLEEYNNKAQKRIGTHLLSSDRTYKEFLPDYLKQTAYI